MDVRPLMIALENSARKKKVPGGWEGVPFFILRVVRYYLGDHAGEVGAEG